MTRITLSTVARSLPFICFGIVAAVAQSPVFGQANYATPYTFTTIAGRAGSPASADGYGSSARFNGPEGLAIDGAGNLYIGDWNNDTIRKLTPVGTNWVVKTIAGKTGIPGSADGTNGAARFYAPNRTAVDGATNIYITDFGNSTIRKITPVGTNWVVTTIAGKAGITGIADGASAARFNGPYDVALDAATNLYVTDGYNSTVRMIAVVGTNWVVTTIAGRAGATGDADGTNGTARFNLPNGVAVDSATNLYISDAANNTIRKITPVGTNWVVTTIAGKAGFTAGTDGPASNARFNVPGGLAVDGATNIYVPDIYNNTIRKITRNGAAWFVTTIAGLTGAQGSADETGNAARFSYPNALALDAIGNLYVVDHGNNTIRQGTPPTVINSSGAGFDFTQEQFGFAITGLGGQTVIVDASTDLQNWSPIWTNTLTFPAAINFTDSVAASDSIRFYRARTP